MVMHVALDTVNINTINILTLDFRIWQHFSRNLTQPHQQKLTNVAEVPVTQLYRNIINTSEPIHSFTIKDDEDSSLIWTIFNYPRTYIETIGMIFAATPRHWPYSLVSLWHAIVDDDDVEVAPIYKHRSKVENPIRHHRNHDLYNEWQAERLESHCKQPVLAKEFLYPDHWPLKPKSQEYNSSNGFFKT